MYTGTNQKSHMPDALRTSKGLVPNVWNEKGRIQAHGQGSETRNQQD